MPNKNYNRAAEYERSLAKHLRTNGAIYATRTPGSKSPVDVIACFENTEVHLIQCKLGKSRPKRSEIDFLRFMVEMGYKAYFVTKTQSKRYQELSLDEVERGPIKDDSSKENADTKALPIEGCGVHKKYRARRKPRVKPGIEGCRCYFMFKQMLLGKKPSRSDNYMPTYKLGMG